jgi:hypothetical protein
MAIGITTVTNVQQMYLSISSSGSIVITTLVTMEIQMITQRIS